MRKQNAILTNATKEAMKNGINVYNSPAMATAMGVNQQMVQMNQPARKPVSDEESKNLRAQEVGGEVNTDIQTSKNKSNKEVESVAKKSRKKVKQVSTGEFEESMFNVDIKSLSHIKDLPATRGLSKGNSKRVGTYKHYITSFDKKSLLAVADGMYARSIDDLYQWYCNNMTNHVMNNDDADMLTDVLMETLEKHGHTLTMEEYVNSANPAQSSLLQAQQTNVFSAEVEQIYNGVDATLEYWYQKVKTEHPDKCINESISIDGLFKVCEDLGYEIEKSKTGLYFVLDEKEKELSSRNTFSVMHVDNGIGMTYSNMRNRILSFNTGNKKNKNYQHGKHNAGATGMIKFSRFEFIVTTMDNNLPEADGNYAFALISHKSFRDEHGKGQYKACYFLVDGEIPHFTKEKEVELNYGRQGDVLTTGTIIKFYQVDSQNVFASSTSASLVTKLNATMVDPIFVCEVSNLNEKSGDPVNKLLIRNVTGRLARLQHYYAEGFVESVRKVTLKVDDYYVQKDYEDVPKESYVDVIISIFDSNAIREAKKNVDVLKSEVANGIKSYIDFRFINHTLHGHAQGHSTIGEIKALGKIKVDGFYRLAENMMIDVIYDNIDNVLLMDTFVTNRENITGTDFIDKVNNSIINYINKDEVIRRLVSEYSAKMFNSDNVNSLLDNYVNTKSYKEMMKHTYFSIENTKFTTADNRDGEEEAVPEGTRVTDDTKVSVNNKSSRYCWHNPVLANLGFNKNILFCTTVSENTLSENLRSGKYVLELRYGKSSLSYPDYVKYVRQWEKDGTKDKSLSVSMSNELIDKTNKDFPGASYAIGTDRILTCLENDVVFNAGTIKVTLPIVEKNTNNLNSCGVSEKDVFGIRCVVSDTELNTNVYEGTLFIHITRKGSSSLTSSGRRKGNPNGRAPLFIYKDGNKLPGTKEEAPKWINVSQKGNTEKGFLSYEEANLNLTEGNVIDDNTSCALVLDGGRLSEVYINSSSKKVKSYLNTKEVLDTDAFLFNLYLFAINGFSKNVQRILSKYNMDDKAEKAKAYSDLDSSAKTVYTFVDSYIEMLPFTLDSRN